MPTTTSMSTPVLIQPASATPVVEEVAPAATPVVEEVVLRPSRNPVGPTPATTPVVEEVVLRPSRNPARSAARSRWFRDRRQGAFLNHRTAARAGDDSGG
jgi:hypothetical protein